MLENWNDGIMGSGKKGRWFIGKIPLDMEIDIVIDKELSFNPAKYYSGLKSTFQYSTIPLFHVRGRSSGLEKDIDILNKLHNFGDVKLGGLIVYGET